MNANELADELENYFDSDYDEIVAMLRQLQAENEALKARPADLTDDEIWEVAVEAWGLGHEVFWFDDDGINLFARAILRKAQENG